MAVPVQRDRTGEPIDPGQDGCGCRHGWLSPPSADVPKPCPVCRPWLAVKPARPPTRAELDAFRLRHPA